MSERMAALTGGVALLERAIGFAVGSLQMVGPDRLGRPTPCADWDLRALLMHMNDSLAALIEAADVGAVDMSQPSGPAWPADDRELTRDLIQSLCARAHYLVGAWSRAAGPDLVAVDDCQVSGSIVAGAGAIEVAVHGWDVARACDHHREIPPALADELLDLARLIIDDADRPQRFDPPVDVSAAASPGDRLVAFTGRRPGAHRP